MSHSWQHTNDIVKLLPAEIIDELTDSRFGCLSPYHTIIKVRYMSRIHPSLLYLTIYNPTLRPSEKVTNDDEDAEEQAQILFYTARERAASRDNMLRQVGLAKALVNFSQ